MISVDNLTVRFGGFSLFESISFMINARDRIGLVGRNGAGKTTLLRIVTGEVEPTEGGVIRSDSTSIGYLPQQMKHMDGKSVYDEALDAFSEVLNIEKRINKINDQLSARSDYESSSYLKLIDDLSHLNEQFELMGGSALHAEVEKTLIGLGFESTDMYRQTSEFSGGWRMRIELAKILLRKPDYILLDEPTNHLDIESIQWLENFLSAYHGAVLLISHDRAFLDNVTNRTIELSMGKLNDYKVSYSKYVELRKERREQELAAYQNQQKKIKDTEEFIERFRYKATKAVQVQSRIKQLDKVDRIEVESEDKSSMNLKFPPSERSGVIVVEAEGLSKAYGENLVLNNIDLLIERGEKVAFVGKNGEGKTTLSKIILNELDYRGKLKIGHNVSIGYFAQNQDEILDENKTVFQTIDAVAVGDIRTKIRDILGAFLFRGEDVDKKVKVLSGGERSRLSLAIMLLQSNNLLVMDEPTNHLDMHSKDILKSALNAYDGTLILVSHDREFLDGLVDKVFEFKNHKVKEHLGGIYDFLKRRKLETLRQLEKKGVSEKQNKPIDQKENKKLYALRKEHEKILRKTEKEAENAESSIEKLEARLGEINILLTDPQKANDSDLFLEYERIQKEMEITMSVWEDIHSKLEKLKAQRN
jgi:ATP-binding cassette, subfamily F, member 3